MTKLDFKFDEKLEEFSLLSEGADKDIKNTKDAATSRANKHGWTIVQKETNPPDIAIIRSTVKNAVINIFGVKNNIDVTVDILMGQLGMETGFKSLHNNNVGNLMAAGSPNQYWKGDVIILLAHEYDKNKNKYYLYSLFRAYDTLEDGVFDWARLLKSKFPAAVAKAEQADITGFVTELKNKNYFTAPVEKYLAGVKVWSKKSRTAPNVQNYAPSAKSNDMWEQLMGTYTKPQNMNVTPEADFQPEILSLVEQMLQQVRASEKHYKQLYKALLPTHHFVIPIKVSDINYAVEFGRVLCSALDEELIATAYIHTDGKNVEVQCDIQGPKELCSKTIQQLTTSLAEVFKISTSKIGGIIVNANTVINKESSYSIISSSAALINYRKFLLKFA